MSRAAKVIAAISLLLSLSSCMSFYISNKQEAGRFPIWLGTPSEITSLDLFGIILLVLAGAMAFAAYRLSSQETEKKRATKFRP